MNPLTGVLRDAWATYRRHFAHFIAISFAIYLVVAALSALLSWGLGTFGAFLGAVISLAGMFLLQAALVKAVHDVHGGRAGLDLGSTISSALPYVGAVAVAGILAAIGITIGLALIIVPGLILLTFWSLIVPEIVIGGARPLESFGRSWRTVRGYGWPVFGTYVLVFLIWIVAEIVLSVDPARPAVRLAQLHRRAGRGHPGRPVHRHRGDLDLLPAHRGARRPGRARRATGRRPAGRAGHAAPGYGQQTADGTHPISGEGSPAGPGSGTGQHGQGAGQAPAPGVPGCGAAARAGRRAAARRRARPPPGGSVPPQQGGDYDTPTGTPGRQPGTGSGQQPGGDARRPGPARSRR